MTRVGDRLRESARIERPPAKSARDSNRTPTIVGVATRVVLMYVVFYVIYNVVRDANLSNISTRGDPTMWVVVAPGGADDSSVRQARQLVADTGLDAQIVTAEQFAARPITSSPDSRVAVLKVGVHIDERTWSTTVDEVLLRIAAVDIRCSQRLEEEIERLCHWRERVR
jgi:hypothetical protein